VITLVAGALRVYVIAQGAEPALQPLVSFKSLLKGIYFYANRIVAGTIWDFA
jgi:hypothetical protein